jgi:aspartate-semialdehyde dehydrogenase
MLNQLATGSLPVTTCLAVASERSVGKTTPWRDQVLSVISVGEALEAAPDIVLFSAGGDASRKYAQLFAQKGCTVIDNSSAWRKDPEIPLVVPEVNGSIIQSYNRIIANPNCSTIQLVVVLKPLDEAFGLRRVVISTYQSVSGSGIKGIAQLMGEREGQTTDPCYPHPIDLNVIPHGGDFLPNGTTTEEEKLLFETRKILQLPELKLTATVVRVPVVFSHSESVNIEFENEVSSQEVREVLGKAPGIILRDQPQANIYPMPLDTYGRDEVFVGRIRADASLSNAIDLWITADNVRKGAATNAVQIAELMVRRNIISST